MVYEDLQALDKEQITDGPCLGVGIDFDDCMIMGEGLVEIAKLKDEELYQQVKDITQNGMKAEEKDKMTWEEGFARRLDLLQMTDEDIETLSKIYAENLTANAARLVRVLREQGIPVFIISGGIRQAMLPVTRSLGIPDDHVFANTLIKDEETGFYTKYDTQTPLAHGRKDLQVDAIRQEQGIVGRLAMIGDGHMDMRAIKGSGIKIGFGGHTNRPEVQEASDIFLTEKSFAAALPLILGIRRLRKLLTEHPEELEFVLLGLTELEGIGTYFNTRADRYGLLLQIFHMELLEEMLQKENE